MINLKHDTKTILKWFRINSLKANPEKFQFMILGKKQCNKVKLTINSIVIKESNSVKLLGITIDNMLNFNVTYAVMQVINYMHYVESENT